MLRILCIFLSLMLLVGCSSSDQLELSSIPEVDQIESTANVEPSSPLIGEDAEETALLQLLQKEVPNPVFISYEYDDFDGDNRKELFVCVETEYEWCGDVWFVSNKGTWRLKEGYYYYTQSEEVGEILNIEGTKLYFIIPRYATGMGSFLWEVKDGIPYELPVSGHGYIYFENDQWYIVQNTLDGRFDGTGRTIKLYYLYWDNGFKEYGGIELSGEEFLKLDGADEILNSIYEKEGVITHIYYRANNIINIGYGIELYGSNEYITCIYDDTSVEVVPIEDNSGVYLPALVEEIAVYPEKFHL